MDFQNRVGGKTGTAGVLSQADANADRRERLRRLALETIDLSKDPYFMKNHLGTYECRLCLTIHTNEGSYLGHTQGKKHQANLGRRAAREASYGGHGAAAAAREGGPMGSSAAQGAASRRRRAFVKIGRPGYKIAKVRDVATGNLGLLFQLHYPDIRHVPSIGGPTMAGAGDGAADAVLIREEPRHRFMSAYEQRVEAPDRRFQYLVVAAEPYETISFKVPAKEIDRSEGKFFTCWDPDSKMYVIQLLFRG